MDIADISQAVQDVYEAAADDPTKLERIIAGAVRYYNRWNPQIIEDTVDTVAEEDTYDMPEDCQGVVKCVWWPTGEPLQVVSVMSGAAELAGRTYERTIPSERMIDEINRDLERRSRQGYYEYRSVENTLRIWPKPPVSGQTIYVTYTAPHVLNEEEDGYDTIPDEDLSILRDLSLAEMLQTQRLEGAMDVAWTIGLVSESPQSRLPALKEAIKEYRKSVENKYQRAVGLLG